MLISIWQQISDNRLCCVVSWSTCDARHLMSAFDPKRTLTKPESRPASATVSHFRYPLLTRYDASSQALGEAVRRREFVTLIGGAVAWPFATRAQPARLPTVGFLGAASLSTWSLWTAAFVQRLRELGWIDGRTIAIEYRWAEGRSERFTEIATEVVRSNVDAIVTAGNESTIAVKQVTSEVPIIFALATDPVAAGLVASLARPGGNVTGFSHQGTDIAAKGLELLREILPNLRRLAILVNVNNSNLVGCSTGKSDGFVPCSILCAYVALSRKRLGTLGP